MKQKNRFKLLFSTTILMVLLSSCGFANNNSNSQNESKSVSSSNSSVVISSVPSSESSSQKSSSSQLSTSSSFSLSSSSSSSSEPSSSLPSSSSSSSEQPEITYDYNSNYHWDINNPYLKERHDFDVVVVEPTYTEEGLETSTCRVCGYQKTRILPKKEMMAIISLTPIDDTNYLRLSVSLPMKGALKGKFSPEDSELIRNNLDKIAEVYFAAPIDKIDSFPFAIENPVDYIFSPSIESIEPMAFYACDYIKTFIFEGDAPVFKPGSLTLNGGGDAIIYCPKEADGWDMYQIDGHQVFKIGASVPALPNMSIEDFYYESVLASTEMMKTWIREAKESQTDFLFTYPFSNTIEDFSFIKSVADEVVKDCQNDKEKADAIFEYVRTHLAYDFKGEYYFPIEALNKNIGVCYQYMCLMHEMLSSQGIIDFQIECVADHYATLKDALGNAMVRFYGPYEHNPMHTFNGVYLNDDIYFYDACWGINYGVDYQKVATNYYVYAVDEVHVSVGDIDLSYYMVDSDYSYAIWKDGAIYPSLQGHCMASGGMANLVNNVAGSFFRFATYNDGFYTNGSDYGQTGAAYRNSMITYDHMMMNSNYALGNGNCVSFASMIEYLRFLNKEELIYSFFASIDMKVVDNYLIWMHTSDSYENVYRIVAYFGKEKELTVPASIDGYPVDEIGYQAFVGNPYLEKVYISEGIKKVWSGSFDNCTNFTDLYIPASVVVLGPLKPDGSAMTSVPSICTGISNFVAYHIHEDNQYFKDVNGVLYSKDMKTLYHYPQKNTSEINLEGVKTIYTEAFANSLITSITIPSSVTDIKQDICKNCMSLKEVTFECGEFEHGHYAFQGCSHLDTVHLSPTMKRVPYSMFIYCMSLETIDIPEGIEMLDDFAFADTNLYHVSLPSTLTYIGQATFNGCSKLYDVNNKSSITDFSNLEGLKNILHSGETTNIVIEGDYVFYKDSTNCIMLSYLGNETVLYFPTSCDGRAYDIHKDMFKAGDLDIISFSRDLHRLHKVPAHHRYQLITEIHIPSVISTSYTSRYLEDVTYIYE